MGNSALFLAIAALLGMGALIYSTQRASIETTNEQSLYQEEMLAQQTAQAGLDLSKSKIMRDFDSWANGAYDATSYQGGAFEVGLAGTPAGPAGPVKITARGTFGQYEHRDPEGALGPSSP